MKFNVALFGTQVHYQRILKSAGFNNIYIQNSMSRFMGDYDGSIRLFSITGNR
jgi:hypothetical protein